MIAAAVVVTGFVRVVCARRIVARRIIAFLPVRLAASAATGERDQKHEEATSDEPSTTRRWMRRPQVSIQHKKHLQNLESALGDESENKPEHAPEGTDRSACSQRTNRTP
ncbi:MAG TPA: hypothetical protein VG963_19995 [Polyangiaceae bacterium]|nr:hypothetical protein [Polyangiaceae bacterium]